MACGGVLKMCFDFLYKFWAEIFLILRRIGREMIKYIGLHVKYPLFLSDFIKIQI